MWTYNYTDELYHYGRKGMKWGQNIYGKVKSYRVKKKRAKSLEKARIVKAEKKAAEEERKKKVEAGRISKKKMTTAELEQQIKRMELEKKYSDLKKDLRSTNKGKRFLEKFLDSTIDKVAENSLADVAAQTLKVLTVSSVNSLFGKEVVATNNKKK